MTAGNLNNLIGLPLSLLRWEMTGLDDEVQAFWQREPSSP